MKAKLKIGDKEIGTITDMPEENEYTSENFMKANCNCGTTFNAETTTETLDGVEIAYSECPDCGQRYLSHIIDDEVEHKLKEVHELVTDNNDISEEQAQAIWNEYNDMVSEARELMKQKESEYQHLVEQVI